MRAKFFVFLTAAVILCMLVVILQFLPIIPRFNYFFSYLSVPVNRVLYRTFSPITQAVSFVAHSRTKMKELDFLKQKVMTLGSQAASLQMITVENDILKRQLNFLEEQKYIYLVSQVIGRSSEESQIVLVLDKGARDGLQPGLPAIINNGMMVGKILKVEEKKSLLLLTIANQSKTAGSLASQTGTSGLVKGEHNLSLKMEMIPKDVDLNVGDLVITSGLEPLVPRGLLLGEIDQTQKNENDLFQTAFLRSFYMPQDLRIVTILLTDHET